MRLLSEGLRRCAIVTAGVTGAASAVAEERVDDRVIELSPIETVVVEGERTYLSERAISASRTSAEVRDLPQAVEVFTRQVLDDQASTRVGDALRFASGVTHAGGNAGNRFADVYNLRGFGGNFVTNGMRRAGGSSLGRSLSQDLANVERIEILKGPSSVLYGDFQPSGLVNLVTKQPVSEALAAIEASYGRYDHARVAVDLGGPIADSEQVQYRFNAAYEEGDSFKDFFEREHVFVAPVVAIRFSDDTQLTFEGEYARDDFLFEEGIPAHGFILPNVNGRIPISRWVGDPSIEGDVVKASSVGYRFEHRFNSWLVLRNAFRWERFDRHEASILPFGLTEDERTLERDFFFSDDVNDDHLLQTDLVAELRTGSVEHELLGGFSFRTRDFEANSLFDVTTSLDVFAPVYGTASRPTGALNDLTAEEDALGIYVQDRVKLRDDLKFLVGLRWDSSEQDQVFVAGSGGPPSITTRDDDELTSQLGIVYQPVETVSLYANRTESFLPQFGTTSGGQPFDPETGTQYEVGVKTELEDRFSINASVYEITKQNIVTADPDDPQFARAIGEAQSRGVEITAVGDLGSQWNVLAAYAYTDTEITRDFEGFEGLSFRNVAEHTFSLLTRYDISGGLFDGLALIAGASYVGDREGDDDNSFELPSYWRADLGLEYDVTESVGFALHVENLFDERYAQSAFGIERVFPGAPRTLTGTVKLKF